MSNSTKATKADFQPLIPNSSYLFSRKEIYYASHDSQGKPLFLETIMRRKGTYRSDNMYLLGDMPMVDWHGIKIPQLNPYLGPYDPGLEAIPFSRRSRVSGENQICHFFEDDGNYRYSIRHKLEQISYGLRKFKLLFTPDCSIYVEDSLSFFGIQSVFMSRLAGAYWQNTCGYEVIPTFTFGNADSLEYCMVGLPKHSMLGVCGVGVRHCHASIILWEYALRCAEKELSPIAFIIYGQPVNVPGLQTPLIFIEDYISKHFRNGRK